MGRFDERPLFFARDKSTETKRRPQPANPLPRFSSVILAKAGIQTVEAKPAAGNQARIAAGGSLLPLRACRGRFRKVAEPLHESVRIALDKRFQPQDFPCRGVRDHADDRCLALHANHSLVRAYWRSLVRPDCFLRAYRPASWTSRHSLMRDMGTPKAERRRLAERGDRPSAPRAPPIRASSWFVRRGQSPPGNA